MIWLECNEIRTPFRFLANVLGFTLAMNLLFHITVFKTQYLYFSYRPKMMEGKHTVTTVLISLSLTFSRFFVVFFPRLLPMKS